MDGPFMRLQGELCPAKVSVPSDGCRLPRAVLGFRKQVDWREDPPSTLKRRTAGLGLLLRPSFARGSKNGRI